MIDPDDPGNSTELPENLLLTEVDWAAAETGVSCTAKYAPFGLPPHPHFATHLSNFEFQIHF